MLPWRCVYFGGDWFESKKPRRKIREIRVGVLSQDEEEAQLHPCRVRVELRGIVYQGVKNGRVILLVQARD